MQGLGIGEVCRLLDIRPHILRYWEAEIPLLDPPKDTGGRRVYRDRELNLLYRLKYLIQERRYTLEGAKLALMDELAGGGEDQRAAVGALRKNLLDLREGILRIRTRKLRFTEKSLFPAGQGHLRRFWEILAPPGRERLISRLLDLDPQWIAGVSSLRSQAKRGGGPTLRMEISRRGEVYPRDQAAAEKALALGRVGFITLLPQEQPPGAVKVALEGLAETLREASYNCGTIPPWYIFAAESLYPAVRSLLQRRGGFFFEFPRGELLRVWDFPFFDTQGRLLLSSQGELETYPSVAAGALLMLRDQKGLGRQLEEEGVESLFFLPLNRFSHSFPWGELLAGHYAREADVSALLFPGRAGPVTTGIYAVEHHFFRHRLESSPFWAEAAKLEALMPGARSTDEVSEVFTERIFSLPFFIAAGAERPWGLLEDR